MSGCLKNGEREINVSDIEDTRDGGDMSLKEAIDRVNEGKESKTEGFPLVARNEGGKFNVADGYHRIAKSIIEGKNKILANVENSIDEGLILIVTGVLIKIPADAVFVAAPKPI